MFHLDEESNSTEIEPNLNNAMLVDGILSDFSDESFYSAMNGDTSITMKQNENILDTSEYHDSTSFLSLPDTKSHANCKNKNPIDVNNSQHQRDVDAEGNVHTTHKHVPLKSLLRQMFDKILENLNEFLSSNSNLTDRSNSTFETNNNSMCQREKFHNIITTSTEDTNDPSKIIQFPRKVI